MQFTPLVDFFCDELQSQYCAGLSYSVSPADQKLNALVRTWILEGKIGAVVSRDTAKFSAVGKVE